jgi:hypothetical protein
MLWKVPLCSLGVLLGACHSLQLPPAEEDARRRWEMAGDWYPCSERFEVSEKSGCSGKRSLSLAARFSERSCTLRSAEGCLIYIELCEPNRVLCSSLQIGEAQRVAIEVTTSRCVVGSDTDCDTLDRWYEGGRFGLVRRDRMADELIEQHCEANDQIACQQAARRSAQRGEAAKAERIYMNYCHPLVRATWACDALLALGASCEKGFSPKCNISTACRIYMRLCALGEIRACAAKDRLGDSC